MQWPAHVSPEEFDAPERMDPRLIHGLGETRQWIKRPMTFTQTPKGKARHPHGDAVSPTATSHSTYSLHKWGVNHSMSAERARIYVNPEALGVACDWDCNSSSVDDLFDIYLLLERMNLWTGIGLYPGWLRKGFHVDLRDEAHPSYRARWFCDFDGNYHKLTWRNWKTEILP